MRAAAEGDAVGGAAAETDAIEEQFLFRCGKNTKEYRAAWAGVGMQLLWPHT